jgi:hypothetical protein
MCFVPLVHNQAMFTGAQMKILLAVFCLLQVGMSGQTMTPPPIKTTFHHCSYIGSSSNSPHLFDTSEIYQCDEGAIEIAGTWNETIEYGYVYYSELGRPGREQPQKATKADYDSAKWCSTPQPWDANQKERCGDKPVICFDHKAATWDPAWQGYSCATPDHDGKVAAPVLSAPLPDRIESASGSGTVTNTWSPAETYEPMDVPAIQECDKKVEGWQVCPWPVDFPKHTGWHFTCADKSRILGTAEDGTKWCRKVER